MRGNAVQRYAAALASWDLDHLSDCVADDVRGNEPGGSFHGLAELKKRLQGWRESYPQGTIETLDLIGEKERVAWRWRLAGKHVLGKPVDITGVIVFEVFDGLIREYWGTYDRLGLQEQLEG